ncbi:uncharacterized protein LOC109814395 [Cajanus cajan]|uniref:Endonuclease/exonuclease/phosphatase domain-containing protein n=1 Tax=Cajanus cajan TaxID=3821 RepID=A0A151RZU7_CAJCA|nr:uncharacterized protein LOC109814395 [Cajanus cajan]KYP48049.1 hypothetical protein KK1_030243 [Cajanus cajan]
MVYASPHPQGWVQLWRDLCGIADQTEGPWMVMRDFNAVLYSHERVGGVGTSCIRGDNAFRDWVNQCNLVDLGFIGAPFTWCRGRLFERLDRALASYDWRLLFPKATLSHLNPLKLDHSPILLKLNPDRSERPTRRPFRFEAAWLTHDGFFDIMRREWNVHQAWNQ